MNIYLALQTIKDSRVYFRRWSPDCMSGSIPGGVFQKQTIDAFMWLHKAGMPVFEEGPNPSEFVGPNFVAPFEVLP